MRTIHLLLALVLLLSTSAADSIARPGKMPSYVQNSLTSAAISRTHTTVRYDSRYRSLNYPMGDVPDHLGVCTDVVIRVFRKIGVDFQELVHEDIKKAFQDYPHNWGLDRPDRNIDHRRVPNLQRFLARQGANLPATQSPTDYQPGDLVTWMLPGNLPHIGIVIGKKSLDGARPIIVHNVGLGPRADDFLFAYPITGHYRYWGS